jgi:Family of unknown function (DUF5703)
MTPSYSSDPQPAASKRSRPDFWSDQGGQYEHRTVTIPRDRSRSDTRQMLTEEAEYGRWELARSVLYEGGERRVWLRRKIIRVRSTF